MIQGIAGFVTGLILTLFGYLIKYEGYTVLVAGYDRNGAPAPDDVVAEVAGGTLFRIGIATIILALLDVYYVIPGYAYVLFTIGVLFAVGRVIYKLNNYNRSKDHG